jgi:gp16 family phage-associated protein
LRILKCAITLHMRDSSTFVIRTDQQERLMQIEAPAKPGDRIRAEFKRQGISVAAWAKKHNLNTQLVHRVLDGAPGSRGESHRAAVLLGLKQGAIGNVDSFNPASALGTERQQAA